VEADLVAHCGVDRGAGFAGGFLYTLTMTDVATGWTECLPLLYQSQDTVLAAIQRARSLFPFPLLGIDTDNGGEFINDLLVTYCEHEHLTFTQACQLPLPIPEHLLKLKQGHWVIENGLHSVKDVIMGEDKSTVHADNGPKIMAALRNTALSLLRHARCSTIAARMRYNSIHPQAALEILSLSL